MEVIMLFDFIISELVYGNMLFFNDNVILETMLLFL